MPRQTEIKGPVACSQTERGDREKNKSDAGGGTPQYLPLLNHTLVKNPDARFVKNTHKQHPFPTYFSGTVTAVSLSR